MTRPVEVSVVMSVFNGGGDLRASVESILAQQGADFEFVIVNDGSTDGSGVVLEEYATSDPRIRILRQENEGLTRALIRGCREARGEFIARQDADNVAAPDRLSRQLSAARANAEVALVSCGTRFVGPGGEFLYDVVQDPLTATADLLTLDVDRLRGPSHHGAAFFPTARYRAAGGYRPEFRVAQDVDLWVRLAETGLHQPLAEVLQCARYTVDGLSSGTWQRQRAVGNLILESARLRRAGLEDRPVLERLPGVMSKSSESSRRSRAKAAYFIGACLLAQRDHRRALAYFVDAFRSRPMHIKTWLRIAQIRVAR